MSEDLIVDVDVHHTWPSDAVLLDYVSEAWKPFFRRSENSRPYGRYGKFHPPHIRFPQVTGNAMRPEATPRVGGPAGSHYETLMEQHIRPNRIARAVLTWGYGLHAGHLNPAASVELCRATNDYMLDHWLRGREGRLRGTIAVPVGVPDEAAREIRRLGKEAEMSAVLLVANPFSKPFGHPVYHPIYAAACEAGLPIITHVGSESVNKGSWNAGGMPTTKTEYYTLLEQSGMHHLSSLLCGGVFETFPSLRFHINEYGFAWLPWLLWNLDSRYAALKIENPGLRRLPSAYFHDHVWMGTQPIAGEAETGRVIRMLELLGGLDKRLCYASDYPHWDTEDPKHVTPRLPASWRAGVMGLNACALFGWSADELLAEMRSDGARDSRAA